MKDKPVKTTTTDNADAAKLLRRKARDAAKFNTSLPLSVGESMLLMKPRPDGKSIAQVVGQDFTTLESIADAAQELREVVGDKELERSLSTLLAEISCAKIPDNSLEEFEEWCIKAVTRWCSIQATIAVAGMKGEGRQRHGVWDIVETLMSDPEWKDAVHIAICTAARNKWLEQGGKKRGLLEVDTMVKQFRKMVHR